jgi:hypothetical protein
MPVKIARFSVGQSVVTRGALTAAGLVTVAAFFVVALTGTATNSMPAAAQSNRLTFYGCGTHLCGQASPEVAQHGY